MEQTIQNNTYKYLRNLLVAAADKPIKAELGKKETERYNNNMKGQMQRMNKNNDKLRGTWKAEPY